MANYIIIHGGWGGGWEWTPVAARLREKGHTVFTPTLTGMGERQHLGQDVGLYDHVQDIQAVIEFEELKNVILCGHSYGGMVITAVADRIPERISMLVYMDAFIPEHGQAIRDLLPAPFVDALIASAEERPDRKIAVPEQVLPPEGDIAEDIRQKYIARMRPQPVKTFLEAVALSGAVERLRRAYVRCTTELDIDDDLLGPYAKKAKAENWPYRELATAHDMHLLDPDATAGVLHELASEQ